MSPQSDKVSVQEDAYVHKSKTLEPVNDRQLTINVIDIYKTLKKFDYSTVIWRNVFIFIAIHLLAFIGLYFVITLQCKLLTFIVGYLVLIATIIGSTMGAHRLWAHRSYKAKFPLRLVLAMMQTTAWQRDIYDWVRDHRVHHKFSESDADPHNAKRGFFFSHMGWLMCHKHPEVVAQGQKIDFSDITADPIVVFQRKHYAILSIILSLIIPCFIPWYFAGESLSKAFYIAVMLRYVISLHGAWSVNSFAHWVGNRPYDSFIYPAQNKWVSFFAGGEGWHNYHHVFPNDYRAAELGGIAKLNYISTLIDLCAKVGLAYDLKTPSNEVIENKANKSGDGTFRGLAVSN